MSVMRDESFGPVVGIMRVRDDEEAIRLMNDSPYGLSAAIWTSDVEAAERIGDRLEEPGEHIRRRVGDAHLDGLPQLRGRHDE